jgi:alpha-galactosidase
MVGEMLVAQEKWLPQYASAITAARERLRNPTVETREWRGAMCALSMSCEPRRPDRQATPTDRAPRSWDRNDART